MASEEKLLPGSKENMTEEGFKSPKPNLINTSSSSEEKNPANLSIGSSENEDYESEPASLNALEVKKKRRMNFKDGKTMHPKVTSLSREVRELAKKHMELEKNLKIEGMPDPPKLRKRRLSVGSNIGRDRDVPFKRKRLNSLDLRPKKDHMPKWGMLGGDASDPLNLNGLSTSEEGRLLNLKTPVYSPLPTPDFRKIVYVKVPPNIEDPLNLEGRHDQRVIDMLLNTTRKKRHRSKKNKESANQSKDENPDSNAEPSVPEVSVHLEKATPTTEDSCSNMKPNSNVKPIQAIRSRSLSMSPDRNKKLKRQISGGKGVKKVMNEPKKFPENPKFTLGNYNRYYGYRNQDDVPDPRLRYFNPEWFEDKDVLDIGCNVGHMTLALAEQFSPRKILGMDIDGKLIGAARQNIRHMLSQRRKDSSKYPSVFEATRGPLEAHSLIGSSNAFPNNVLFLQGNYVPGSEEILQLQKEEYDIILALSITKWIHLNNGDHGLKLFFQKIHRQLRPGGRLILEPQPWSTYRKRAKMTPELFKNYSSAKLRPEGFKNYLLSIGFVKCEVIGVPVAKAKGFRRPLILFTKADPHASSSSSYQHPMEYNFRFCTECQGGQQAFCDHIQFTGMRQGAYADRLYDHLKYPPSGGSDHYEHQHWANPSPFNSSLSKDSFYAGIRYLPISPCVPPGTTNFRLSATPKADSERSPSSSISANGSQVQSDSERSWTSESSHSSSSSSCSSSSPALPSLNGNGLVNGNGDIAADIHNENANMDFEHVFQPVVGDGGDSDSDVDIEGGFENGGNGVGVANGHLSTDDEDSSANENVNNQGVANGHVLSSDEEVVVNGHISSDEG